VDNPAHKTASVPRLPIVSTPPVPPVPSQPATPPPAGPAQYVQPQYPPSYAQTPHPAYAPAAAPAGPRTGNPLGVVSVILVGVLLVLDMIRAIASGALFAARAFEVYSGVSLLFAVLQALVAAGALVLGAIALAAKGRPKALAGIGVGAGAVMLFGILMSWLGNNLVTAFAG
jgi:hypothetical protein